MPPMTHRRWLPRVVLAAVAAVLSVGLAARAVDVAAQAPRGAPTAVLSGEWMLPASSTDTWHAMDAVVARLGLKTARSEERFGAVVTRLADLPPGLTGSPEAAGLPPLPARSRVEVHLHVMRGLEPARLAIGVVTETDTGGVMTRAGRTVHAERRFGNVVLRARVLKEVEAVLGVVAEPLAASPAGRAAQALRLLPAGLDGGCGVREAAKASKGSAVQRPPARTGYDVKPVYPRGAMERGADAAVQVRAVLTEHGTLDELALVGTHTTSDEFARAALGAFELWRFTPMFQDGCPVRVDLTLRSRFNAS